MYIYIYCQLRAEDNPLPIGGCRIESQDSQYPETCCEGKDFSQNGKDILGS